MPAELSSNTKDIIIKTTLNSLNALQIQNGASHTELKVKPNGDIYIIEIGARMGGDFIGSDLIPISTGYDYLAGVVQISLGEFHPPGKLEEIPTGIIYTLPSSESLDFNALCSTNRVEIIKRSLITQNPREKKKLAQSSDRCGYIIYKGNHITKLDQLLTTHDL